MDPDLGIALKKKHREGNYFIFNDFIIGNIVFSSEYTTVNVRLLYDGVPHVGTFDFSPSDFIKFIQQFTNNPAFKEIISKIGSIFEKSLTETLVYNVFERPGSRVGEAVFGFLSADDVDGNNMVFAPLRSYELYKIENPAIFKSQERPLFVIATEIYACMIKENIRIPQMNTYLQAMLTLSNVDENYGYDNGLSIVSYFLANSKGWRGSVEFTELKKELKTLLKHHETK